MIGIFASIVIIATAYFPEYLNAFMVKRNKIIEFYKKEMEEQGIKEGEGILEWNESKLNEDKLGFGWG
ncbi:hypothetical protein [Bacillus xiapuensis]|uniref:Uncharacterized protein n=1 Tax=Bacillus xiapuensis TaxID=2014075 RepID=A0ABU6ND22_9BACI|nr:hypothetical protein [Bacillus xiapuensis]